MARLGHLATIVPRQDGAVSRFVVAMIVVAGVAGGCGPAHRIADPYQRAAPLCLERHFGPYGPDAFFDSPDVRPGNSLLYLDREGQLRIQHPFGVTTVDLRRAPVAEDPAPYVFLSRRQLGKLRPKRVRDQSGDVYYVADLGNDRAMVFYPATDLRMTVDSHRVPPTLDMRPIDVYRKVPVETCLAPWKPLGAASSEKALPEDRRWVNVPWQLESFRVGGELVSGPDPSSVLAYRRCEKCTWHGLERIDSLEVTHDSRTVALAYTLYRNIVTPTTYRDVHPRRRELKLPELFEAEHLLTLDGSKLTVTWDGATATYTTDPRTLGIRVDPRDEPWHVVDSTSPRFAGMAPTAMTIYLFGDRIFEVQGNCPDAAPSPRPRRDCDTFGGFFTASLHGPQLRFYEVWAHRPRNRRDVAVEESRVFFERARSLIGTWRIEGDTGRAHAINTESGVEHWLE